MQKEIWLQHLDLQRIVSVAKRQAKHFQLEELAGASYFDAKTQRIELIIFESLGCCQQDIELLKQEYGQHYFLFHSVSEIVRSNLNRCVKVS